MTERQTGARQFIIKEAHSSKEAAPRMFLSRAPLTERQKEDLVHYSTDPSYIGHAAILHNTSDKDRFATKEKVNEWLAKERFYVKLVDIKGKLLGICWLGPEAMPTKVKSKGKPETDKPFIDGFTAEDAGHYGITYAIRTYAEANGARVSTQLTDATREAYKQTDEYKKLQAENRHHTWLEVASDNAAGIASYTRSGARIVTDPYRTTDKYDVEHTKINMVFTDTDPRAHKAAS